MRDTDRKHQASQDACFSFLFQQPTNQLVGGLIIRYIIVSSNALSGHINPGPTPASPIFFWREGEDGRMQWTNTLSLAKAFTSEERARRYSQDHWGYGFSNQYHAIIGIHESNIYLKGKS